MNGWSNTWSGGAQPPRDAASGPYAYSARPRWRALEIAAIVLGFMVWWVVGLSLLLWKLWRNRQGYSTDMITAARGAFQENVMNRWPDISRSFSRGANRAPAAREWGFASFRSSGNSAFDAWREGELRPPRGGAPQARSRRARVLRLHREPAPGQGSRGVRALHARPQRRAGRASQRVTRKLFTHTDPRREAGIFFICRRPCFS